MELEALDRANGLRAVIEQVEAGDVLRIRDRYGPEKGRKASPTWARIKVTITRRERIYEQLSNEFHGNKDKFFQFFTVLAHGAETMRPYRKIAQAIPWMSRDLEDEMAQGLYLDPAGKFSQGLWEQHWGDRNRWEVWRELGKERYN